MKRFIEGENRDQSVLFPERLDDYIGEDNPVRAIDVFVDGQPVGKLDKTTVEEKEVQIELYAPGGGKP